MKKTLITVLTIFLIAATGFFLWPKISRHLEGQEKMRHISTVLRDVEKLLDSRPYASISKEEAREFALRNQLITLGYYDEQKSVMNTLYDNGRGNGEEGYHKGFFDSGDGKRVHYWVHTTPLPYERGSFMFRVEMDPEQAAP
jgi:hypothetical protein